MKAVIISSLVLVTQLVFAHGDHPPRVAKCAAKKCTKEEIMSASSDAVRMIADRDKKKSSWASVKASAVEEKQFAKGTEYVVTFEDKSKPEGEKKLYVFITTDGFLNGSNYSGQ